jgi:hypothetical protein
MAIRRSVKRPNVKRPQVAEQAKVQQPTAQAAQGAAAGAQMQRTADSFAHGGTVDGKAMKEAEEAESFEADPELASEMGAARMATQLAVGGRGKKGGQGGKGQQGGFNPVDGDQLKAGAAGALGALGPSAMKNVDGLGMLDAVQDGRVQLEVPLKAGTYTFGGHDVKVKEGTKALVDVEVKDGKLQSIQESKTGGTRVKIDPPIEGPLWITGKGAYVSGKDGQGKVMADVGGWFDKKLGDKGSLGLGDTVRRMKGDGSEPKKPKKAGDSNPADMFQLDKLKFNAGRVKLKPGELDLGAAKLNVGKGNRVNISGDGQHAELSGKVAVDGMTLKQDGLDVKAGKGSADLRVTTDRNADGSYDVRAQLKNVNAKVPGLDLTGEGGDKVSLSDARLSKGSFDLRTRVGQGGGVSKTKTEAKAQVSARLNPSQLSVKDADGDAKMSFSADQVKASVAMGPGGVKLDGALKGADVSVEGFQSKNGDAGIDLHHAKVKGDASLSVDSGTGKFAAEVKGDQIDVRLDDYQGGSGGVKTDLGRTDVTGSGTVKMGTGEGLHIEGDLKVKGRIDDLQVSSGDGESGASFDVAPGGSFDGKVRKLAVSDEKGFELDASARVDMGLENYKVNLPGVSGHGVARMTGDTNLKVGGGKVEMSGKDVNVDVALKDGKIAPGSNLSLDMAEGSEMSLKLKHAKYTAADGNVEVKIGAGSKVDAKLDGGQVKVGDYELELDKGAKAHLDVHGMRLSSDGVPELHGSLEVDAGGALTADGMKRFEQRGAAVVSEGNTATGKLKIDDVKLTADGELQAKGVDLQMKGKVGTFTAITKAETTVTPTEQIASGALSEPTVQPGDPNYVPPANKDVGQVAAPDGMHDAWKVANTSAAKMAGVQKASGDFNAFEAAKKVKDGKLEMTIPVEGKVGSGLKGATFEKGTKLKVTAEVKDGKLVPGKLKAEFSKPGDAVGWVTAKGAYLDDDNQLRLDLGGMYDFSAMDLSTPGQKGPPTVGKLVDGIQGKASGGGKSSGPSAFKAADATISVRGATVQPGALDMHFGSIKPGPDTKLDIEGSLTKATMRGSVDIQELNIGEDAFAMKGAKGRADLEVTYENKSGGGHSISTKLSNVDLETQDVVHRSGGKYFHLESGKIDGGTIEMTTNIGGDGKPVRGVKIDLPSLDGELHSARFNAGGKDSGDNRMSIGRTGFNGAIKMDGDQVTLLKGDVRSIDASVHGVELATGEGLVSVEGARIKGSGKIDYTPERLIALDGDVTIDAVVDRSQVQLHKLGLPVDRTVLADGKTHIKMDLKDFQELSWGKDAGGATNSLKIEGGDVEVKGKMSDIVGRFVVPK